MAINTNLGLPGFYECAKALEGQRTWEEVQATIDTSESSFWLAFAMARQDYVSQEVRQAFQASFPELVDKTNDGIAAIIYTDASRDHMRYRESVDDSIESRLAHYDPALHPAIKAKVQEVKWILLPGRH